MSFAAEPYGVFVDDLVSSLTGGVTREEFRYPNLASPWQLAFRDDHLPKTVRIQGIVDGAYTRFERDRDFKVDAQGFISWIADDGAADEVDARRPDRGSRFYVSYERTPASRHAPLLTDRNPGSVLRTLAESFAREFAVISKQMEKVYKAGFLATAVDRDLDQVVALVGVHRRTQQYASGEVVFNRDTPAPADIYIPAGTRISTSDVPPVTVETNEARTLRAGSLSEAVPVRSTSEGTEGKALADSLTVIHRPILGIQHVTNPLDLGFVGEKETDEGLRKRAARALEGSGASTIDAIVSALTTIEGLREQDVKVTEDHVNHPGLIKITIAASLTTAQAVRAAELINEARPAGIKVLHNLNTTPQVSVPALLEDDSGPAEEAPAAGTSEDVWFPLAIRIKVIPTVAALTTEEKKTLSDKVAAAVSDAVGELGIGDPVIYNALVAVAMTPDGVKDVLLEVYPLGAASGRSNIIIPQTSRARLDSADLSAGTIGALVALDLSANILLKGRLLLQDEDQAVAFARDDISTKLGAWLGLGQATIEQPLLLGQLPSNDDYEVTDLTYNAEFVEQGLVLLVDNPTLALDADQQPWLRTLKIAEVQRAD